MLGETIMLCISLVVITMGPCPFLAKTIPGVGSNNTLTLGYLLSWSHEWAVGPYIGSAIEVAIKEIGRRQLLPGYNIEWILEDTWCQPGRGIKAATEVWFKADDLDALIGGGCSVVCLPVSLLAAAWGIPVMSYGCTSDRLSNKVTYPTFARTVGLGLQKANILYGIAEVFNWKRLGIITDNSDISLGTAQQLEMLLKASGKEPLLYVTESTTADSEIDLKLQKLRQVLRVLKSSCRVIAVVMYSLDFRNLLATAYEEDMLSGYVYMGAEGELPLDTYNDFRPDLGLEIYEGVIDLEVSVPEGPEWDNFRQEVIDSFQSPKFDGWEHISPNASIDVVNNYAGLIHDAVLLWAYGVNRTLEQGYAPDDGPQVLSNIIDLTFDGITGSVAIDDRGDRKSDYTVRMIQNGTMVPILHYVAAEGEFAKVYSPDDQRDWSGLLWPGNYKGVPKDSPPCGWKNEFCSESGADATVPLAAASSAIALLLVIVMVALFVLRRQRYKTDFVAVKSLGSVKVNIKERRVLIELTVMKEMYHENLNPFIGMCVEEPHVCILMLYASRGSLQDIIAHAAIDLTADFKLSLATDIARGMNAIHISALGFHGHLTSSNCIIDNRWVCKITDYGLHYIRHSTIPGGGDKQPAAESLLWTAPELLNQPHYCNGTKKGDVYSYGIILQELLLQSSPYYDEILTARLILEKVKARCDPPYRPVIKTGVCSSDWSDLMKSCWNDSPDARPTFPEVLSRLRKINGGVESTLVDSMIKRLEMHSTKLEDIVAQRSLELVDEKEKLERLLLELLPKSITENLKLGRKVEPESFDCVTIFFSDLVGFTRISAAGTPLDVVKMLNLMYTVFDDIATNFDVYKVATIGDAYFVASGVPNRNGNKHASEITNMALDLLKAVSKLAIPHIPDESLKLRIGIHTGPCLAGVVGIKMPRYLLFGDTIDIASQMESKGKTMKIHISQTTEAILPNDSYLLSLRDDPIEVKGHGLMPTYWLQT